MGNIIDLALTRMMAAAKRLGVEIHEVDVPHAHFVLVDTFVDAPVLVTSSTEEALRFLSKLPAIKDSAPIT